MRLERERQRANFGGFDAPAQLAELRDPEFGGARLTLVASAVLQHDEAVAVLGVLEPTRAGDGRHVLVALDGMKENVADRPVETVDALYENDQPRLTELLE